MASFHRRVKRVTDPLDDRVKAQLVGAGYFSSGSEHSASSTVVGDDSPSLSELVHSFLQDNHDAADQRDGNDTYAADADLVISDLDDTAQCFLNCEKHDPEVNEDTEKNFTELLTEELKLREAEALESQQRADMALLEAKKIASQYQKEADKCSSGMETCEEAREKAEAALVAQKKLTEMWETRARQKGWREGVAKSHTNSQGNVQAA